MELTPLEACKLLTQTATAKFPESAELHARLNIDPKYTDQQVRGERGEGPVRGKVFQGDTPGPPPVPR